MDVRTPFFQNIACVLIGVLFLNPIVSTAAQLTVDAQAGGNTSLNQAGNGVPIVNIATPNGSGLSHNKFSDYNVGQQGLILNNATSATQSTQLGGIILGNPNFNGQAAGLILNEVTGANASQLKGYTEVAGKSAAVIVANPHGISCDGCGFINTPRATLTTGKPIVENGRLDRFDVDGGQITIEGDGLNASNIEQFDLITRSAKINAELHANKLNVITGRNQVDADTLNATAKADDGSSKPQLAIDSSALGGMYAGAIRLVGTEAGVGVKLAGDMAASAGDIQIDANGQLSLAQTAASRDILLKGESIELTGKSYAGRNVDAQAQQSLSLAQEQSLAARERIELKGAQLDNQGLIEAGVNADNSRNLSGDVKLSGDSLRNSGSVIASRELSAVLDGQLDNRAGTLSGKTNTSLTVDSLNNGSAGRVLSQGSLTIGVDELDNRGGLIASAKDLSVIAETDLHNQAGEISSQTAVTLQGRKLDNQGGLIAADSRLQVTVAELDNSAKGTLSSQGTLTATVTGKLDNHGEGALVSQGALSVQAQTLDNRQGGVLSSKGSLAVTDATVDNQGGAIVAEQQLTIDGKSLDNRDGLVSGKADISVDVDALLDNREQGTLVADGKLTVDAAELRNADRGQVAAKGDLEITVDQLSQQGDADTATQAGELLSQGKLTLVADSIDNRQGGLIAASKGLDIRASELLRNGGGEISTQGQAEIRAQAAMGKPVALLDNSGAGLIIGDQGLTLTVQRLLNNAKGLLAGRDSLVLIGDSLDNSAGGTLSSQITLDVRLTGALENQGQGALLSGGSLTVEAANLNNSAGGLLSSAGTLSVDKAALNNQGGKLVSDGQLTITNSSLDNSNSGIISAKQALTIGTGLLDNQAEGLITSGAGLAVTAGQINNYEKGLIAGKGAVQVTATGLDQHAGGELISETSLTLDLQGGDLNNSGKGLVATPGALLLKNLGKVDNSADGEISSAQSFLLKASELDNSAGRIISSQDLHLQITQALLNNLKGALSAAKLTVEAASLNNSGAGVLASKGDLTVDLEGKLDNHDQGLISAGQALTIDSDELDNSSEGLLASGGALTLTTGEANNQGGTIASQTTLNATSADLDNRNGVISSQQALTLTADAVDNRDNGLITSAASLTLTADSLDSSRDLALSGGEVSAKQALTLTVKKLIQRQGRLIGEAGVSLDLQGGDLDNRDGLLFAKGPLTFANLRKLDNRGGELSSSQSYSLVAGEIDNGDKGELISSGTLTIDLGKSKLRNAAGGLISGWQGLTVNAGNVDNSGLGTLSSRDGDLDVELSGALNNSDEGALVSKGELTVEAASLDNSAKGIVSSEGDLELTFAGKLNNSDGGLIDSQGTLNATAGEVDNSAGQLGSAKAATITAASLDNSAGQLSSNAALTLTLTGDLTNTQGAKLASVGPLVLKAAAIDNQGGSLISQNLLHLTGTSLNNGNGGTLAASAALDIVLGSGVLINSADGLIHSEKGALDIQAQSLNNNEGALSSQQDLTLKLDGKLDNQKGRIESLAGNLDLQKSASVDNSGGGVLSSVEGWLKLVSAGLFDNDAGTAQAQSVKIDAKGVDNQAGHISALKGDTEIIATEATFNNQGGGLYAHQLLKVIAGNFNNDGTEPAKGGKAAAERIDFSLSGALNNSYGILESASTLSLAAASIDNQYGSLRALGTSGDTSITADSLDNRNGKIETANTNLIMNVGSLQSSGGDILHVGTGNFGLSAAHVTGAGGDLSTNGLLTLTADSWTNSGVLQAGKLELDITTFTQTATGQLLAGTSLTGKGGTWINNGLLASDGILDLDLTGAYSGSGQVTSLGDLTLEAASLDLTQSARIAGGGLTTVTADGLLTNLGKLTSAGDLTVTANTLNNYGTLGSAEKLRLVAPTVLNENGLIFSGGDMALRGQSLLNLRGDIYSLGNLHVAAQNGTSKASSVRNLSGTIEAAGSLTLLAETLENARETFDIESKKYAARIVHIGCHDCSGDKEDVLFRLDEIDRTEATNVSPQAQLLAGSDMHLVSDELENRYSLIAAGNNLHIDTAKLNNLGAETGDVNVSRTMQSHRVKSISGYRSEALSFTARNWYTSPTFSPGNIEAEISSFISRNIYRAYGLTQPVVSNAQYYHATIQAAGDVVINATEQLNNSVIQPHYAYVAGGNRVQSSAPGTGYATYVPLSRQLPPDLQQQQINPLTLPGFSLPQGENGLFRLNGQDAAISAASSAPGAAGDNTLNSSSVTVGAGQAAQGPVATNGSAWSMQSGQGSASNAGGTPTDAAALALIGVQSLPGSAVPSTSHKYLIETNPELTSLKRFLGSDYMLGLLGYDTDAAQKRLGDGLYEQRLIREAVIARTGQRFLAGLTSDEAMFRYLMDNAIASKQALNLSVGISLTAEQVAALTHDLVWLEEYEVAGEKVLVPVLYLAQAEGRLAPNGALIQGRDVTLISGGELNNQGTLRASGNLDVSAGSIDNAGLMQASERLSLLAVDSIRNTQGGIIAGRDVSVIALTGDIRNERSVTTHESAQRGYIHREDFVDSAARIEAINDLTLSAGRDIQNVGGAVTAGRDLQLDAGRDLLIVAAEEHDLTKRVARKSNNRIERISQHASEISAGRDLALSTERDLAVVASRVSAGQDLTVGAGGDVLLASAANESHYEAHRRGGGKKVDIERSTVSQQSTELSAGGDLHIEAGHDLTAVASELEAGGEAYLYAGGDLSLLAAEDSDYQLYDMKKKGSWGSKKTQRDEVTTVSNVGTSIEAGGDLTLVSEGDQLYQRAHLESGADLTLESGGEIAFEGVKDLKQESHEKSDDSALWKSMKGKGTTDETVVQSELIAAGEITIKAVEGIRIDIKEVNQQSVQQTIDAMVQADPELAWLKEMEARGDVDWRRVKEIHDSFKYQHSGMGPVAQLIVAIVMAAVMGPAAVSALGTVGGAAATSLATTGVSSAINNKGNLGVALKETFSSDSLKNAAVAGVTAGLTEGVFDKVLDTKTNAVTGKVTVNLSSVEGVGRFAANQALQQGTSAALNKALGRDVSFKDGLQGALFNTLMATSFNAVGDYSKSQNWADGSPQKIAMHALVGGLLAEATGSDFASGAIAAGANEALVKQLAALVNNDSALLTMSSQLVGLAAAGLIDGDVAKGAEVAKNATQYNFLNHLDVEEMDAALKKCGADVDCERKVRGQFQERSAANNSRLNSCSANGNCAAIQQEIQGGLDALASLNGLSSNAQNIVGAMTSYQEGHLQQVESRIALDASNQKRDQELVALGNDPERFKLTAKASALAEYQHSLEQELLTNVELQRLAAKSDAELDVLAPGWREYRQQVLDTTGQINTAMGLVGDVLEPDLLDALGPAAKAAKLAGVFAAMRGVGKEVLPELTKVAGKLDDLLTGKAPSPLELAPFEKKAESKLTADIQKANQSLASKPTVGSGAGGAKGNGSETPYNPQTTRNELESTYGRDNVLSTTVPPVDGRNVHLAGQRHPVTGVVFDNRGFPIFDDVAAFDTRISIDTFKSASYEGQMKLATKDLLGAIQQGQVKASSFTAKQLQQISAGAKKIDGYTWHHHQDSGRMQLVPELIHSKTGHIGGEAMGGGM
jgi:filamentous hemagglutinin